MTPKYRSFFGLLFVLAFVALTAACGGGMSPVGPDDDPTPPPSVEKMTVSLTVTVNGTEIKPVNGNDYRLPVGTSLFNITVMATIPQVAGRTFRFCESPDGADCSNYSSTQRHVDWPQGYLFSRTYDANLRPTYFVKFEETGPGLPNGSGTASAFVKFTKAS